MPISKKKTEGIRLEIFFRPSGFAADLVSGNNKNADEKEQRKWYERLKNEPEEAFFHLGFLIKQEWMTPSLGYLMQVSQLFIRRISARPDIEIMREETDVPVSDEDLEFLLEASPFANGSEFITKAWLTGQWDRLLQQFRQEITAYQGTVSAFFAEHSSNINVAGRVFFHLVESKDEKYPFAFMATYSVKKEKNKRAVHTPLEHALMEFKNDPKKLLELMAAVGRAAENSSFISDLMESGELFSPLRFTAREAYTFLKEVPLYEAAGVMCRVPDWWRRRTNALTLSMNVGNKAPSKVGLDAILDFNPALMIDGEKLTKKQLKEFLAMAEGLVLYKGRWVEVDHEKLKAALEALEKAELIAKNGGITMAEAMRMELDLREKAGIQQDFMEVRVSNGKWLKNLKNSLTDLAKLPEAPLEPTFQAVLRPYQLKGYEWLNAMGGIGFGACLADDMGLGKTVQVIAYLEHCRIEKGGHALLIVPASLIGNWQKEVIKFAPDMTVQILHKSAAEGEKLSVDESCFLCITTYGMAARLEELSKRRWDILVIDEAQAIKNAGTRQSKAVKAIPAAQKIAMTGTPIENRLSDLWSLFDFLNQGLLGTPKEFAAFVKRLDEDQLGYGPLKKMVNPFILRRLKTDRSIISDLPDKVEIMEYAPLSQKQRALYMKLVKDLEKEIREAEGIARKGIILSSIIKLKQICNHPDQYLGLDNYKKEASGKFEQLEQICETIYEKRERVLVFTQFKEMTEPLSEFLSQIFHKKGLVIHGSTSVKKRSEKVEAFNGEEYIPYMVLSLKAGGVGLNLTAANHVIHFDRWWNPAVENQATDRAFRIGQKKNVMVYKLVTQGTIEEKIDAMIEEKKRLAGDILSSAGETWITELSDEDLFGLLKLGGEEA